MRIKEIFSQFVYHQPQDPLKIMIDFYFMVGYVYGTDFSDEVVDWVMKEAVKDCVDAHAKHMVLALKYCCAAELKHITEYCNALKRAANENTPEEARKVLADHYSPLTFKFLAKYLTVMPLYYSPEGRSIRNKWIVFNRRLDLNRPNRKFPVNKKEGKYLHQFRAVVTTQRSLKYSDAQLAQVFVEMFDDDEGWHGAYGGNAWQKIAQCMLDIIKSKKTGDQIVYCDHAYDLAHNTGIVFNKIENYAKNGNYNWIKDELDWKRDNKSLKAFYDKVSTQLQPVVAYVSKFKYDDPMLPPDPVNKQIDKIKQGIQGKEDKGWEVVTNVSQLKVGDTVKLTMNSPDTTYKVGSEGVVKEINPKKKKDKILVKYSDGYSMMEPYLCFAVYKSKEENNISEWVDINSIDDIEIGDTVRLKVDSTFNRTMHMEKHKKGATGKIDQIDAHDSTVRIEHNNDHHTAHWEYIKDLEKLISNSQPKVPVTFTTATVGAYVLINPEFAKIHPSYQQYVDQVGQITELSPKFRVFWEGLGESVFANFLFAQPNERNAQPTFFFAPEVENKQEGENIPVTAENAMIGDKVVANPVWNTQYKSILGEDFTGLTGTISALSPSLTIEWEKLGEHKYISFTFLAGADKSEQQPILFFAPNSYASFTFPAGTEDTPENTIIATDFNHLKVGDKVQIKKNLNLEMSAVTNKMLSFAGKTATITKTGRISHNGSSLDVYSLDIDNGVHYWTVSMLEPIENTETENGVWKTMTHWPDVGDKIKWNNGTIGEVVSINIWDDPPWINILWDTGGEDNMYDAIVNDYDDWKIFTAAEPTPDIDAKSEGTPVTKDTLQVGDIIKYNPKIMSLAINVSPDVGEKIEKDMAGTVTDIQLPHTIEVTWVDGTKDVHVLWWDSIGGIPSFVYADPPQNNSHETKFKVGDKVKLKVNPTSGSNASIGMEGIVISVKPQCIGVEYNNGSEWSEYPDELELINDTNKLTIGDFVQKIGNSSDSGAAIGEIGSVGEIGKTRIYVNYQSGDDNNWWELPQDLVKINNPNYTGETEKADDWVPVREIDMLHDGLEVKLDKTNGPVEGIINKSIISPDAWVLDGLAYYYSVLKYDYIEKGKMWMKPNLHQDQDKELDESNFVKKEIHTVAEFEVHREVIFTNVEQMTYKGVITKNTGKIVYILFGKAGNGVENEYDQVKLDALLEGGRRKFEILIPENEYIPPTNEISGMPTVAPNPKSRVLTPDNVKVGMKITWNPEYVEREGDWEDRIYKLTAVITGIVEGYSSTILKVHWSDDDNTEETTKDTSSGLYRFVILDPSDEVDDSDNENLEVKLPDSNMESEKENPKAADDAEWEKIDSFDSIKAGDDVKFVDIDGGFMTGKVAKRTPQDLFTKTFTFDWDNLTIATMTEDVLNQEAQKGMWFKKKTPQNIPQSELTRKEKIKAELKEKGWQEVTGPSNFEVGDETAYLLNSKIGANGGYVVYGEVISTESSKIMISWTKGTPVDYSEAILKNSRNMMVRKKKKPMKKEENYNPEDDGWNHAFNIDVLDLGNSVMYYDIHDPEFKDNGDEGIVEMMNNGIIHIHWNDGSSVNVTTEDLKDWWIWYKPSQNDNSSNTQDIKVGERYSYKLNDGTEVTGTITGIKDLNQGGSALYTKVSFTVDQSNLGYGGAPAIFNFDKKDFLHYISTGRAQKIDPEKELNDAFGPVQWEKIGYLTEIIEGDLIRDSNRKQYEVLKVEEDGLLLQKEGQSSGAFIRFSDMFVMGPWEKVVG
jgi:ribosomal protein L21E